MSLRAYFPVKSLQCYFLELFLNSEQKHSPYGVHIYAMYAICHLSYVESVAAVLYWCNTAVLKTEVSVTGVM